MDIKELNSFRLSDAVKFHDKLNPKLWSLERLRPEVKKQLQLIAQDFIDYMGVSNLNVKDITISGSNAAYSYTKNSDIDLHIIVDMDKLPNDEVYRELFDAKKTMYNDIYDIKLYGIPVELYVQNSNEPVISLGEFSIKDNKWIKIPKKRKATLDQHNTRLKYEKLKRLILTVLKSRDLKKVINLTKKIRQYRQAGLDKGGEFSPENLAYKVLRTQGYITKLYDLRDKLHGENLTIENMYMNPDLSEDETLQFAAAKTPVISPYVGIKDNRYRGGVSEASGYIPSEKEKNDPRFKTALTVDVRPFTMKKDAKKFGNKISRAGIPPTLKASGKF